MVRVVICDDEKAIRQQLKNYLSRYFTEKGEEYELTEYSSANDLLQNYPTGIDLLLLDIYMAGIDGMEAAREIRKWDEEVCIIFITTMYQRAIDGYAVRAFGFVRKPINYTEIRYELDCVLRQIERKKEEEKFVVLRSGGTAYRLPISRIYYCEVRNHDMCICQDGIVGVYRSTMSELENLLIPHGFLRCHSSFLVNPRYIQVVEQSQLVMKNGTQIPISQRKKKEFLTELSAYMGERL